MNDGRELLRATARVAAVRNGQLWLEGDGGAGCGGCSLRHGCPSAVLAGMKRDRPLAVPQPGGLTARPGDLVIVGIPRAGLQRATLWLYLLPVVALLLGAVLGEALGGTAVALAGGVVGLAAGLAWSGGHLRRYAATATPRVLAMAEAHGEPCAPHDAAAGRVL